jgi:hypothetical protein
MEKEFIIPMLFAISPWIVFLLIATGLADKEIRFKRKKKKK